MLRSAWREIFNKDCDEQERIARETSEAFRKEYERMSHSVIYLPDEVFSELRQYTGMAEFENRIEFKNYVLVSEKHKPSQLMKRYEATKIVNQAFGMTDTGQAAKWVRIFEQLGMLKLEPEAERSNLISIIDTDGDTQQVRVEEAVKGLEKAGFTVTIK